MNIGIIRIDEKVEEIAECLQTLGIKRMSARSLAGIHRLGTAKTRDIEKISGLRQPEVSVGVKDLIRRGWVSESQEKQVGKGRPNKVYKLKVGFDKVLANITLTKNDERNKVAESIIKLKIMSKKTRSITYTKQV